MSNLQKLEKKIAEKVNEVKEVSVEPIVSELLELKYDDGYDNKLLIEIQKVYRLISNCDNRIERRLNFIEQKLNYIVKAIENSGVDIEEIKKQEEIKALEQKLKKLKGV